MFAPSPRTVYALEDEILRCLLYVRLADLKPGQYTIRPEIRPEKFGRAQDHTNPIWSASGIEDLILISPYERVA